MEFPKWYIYTWYTHSVYRNRKGKLLCFFKIVICISTNLGARIMPLFKHVFASQWTRRNLNDSDGGNLGNITNIYLKNSVISISTNLIL